MKLFIYSLLFISFLLGQNDLQFLGFENESVRTIAVNRYNPSIIYVGTDSLLLKTVNQGESWQTLASGLVYANIALHPNHPDTLMVVTSLPFTPGILKSVDGGEHFNWSNDGIYSDWETGPVKVKFHPTNPETLYTAVNGFLGGALYRSPNGGHNWFPIEGLWMGTGIIDIAINPSQPSNLYASINYLGEVYASGDDGNTWNELGVPWREHGLPKIHVDPFNSDRIYAGVWVYGFGVSDDRGQTWSIQQSIAGRSLDLGRVVVETDVLTPNHIYLGVGGLNIKGLFESFDGGESWEVINDTLNISILHFDSQTRRLFIGTFNGLYVYNSYSEVQTENLLYPEVFGLKCFPNPFNENLKVVFFVPKKVDVRVEFFNMLGNSISTCKIQNAQTGYHSFIWDTKTAEGYSLPSGIYICKVSVGGSTMYKRITLLK